MIRKSSALLVTAAVCVTLVCSMGCRPRETDVQAREGSNARPQCGQHCAHYCCQLLGVPVSMDQVCQLLPPKNGGESMLEIAQFLRKAGLECSGEKASFEDLLNGPFPVIAHLIKHTDANTEVQHFVVVERADSSSVKILDGHGRRGEWKVADFLEEWRGFILRVMRPDDGLRRPNFISNTGADSAWLQFDTLFLDAGDVPQSKDEYLFAFDFTNKGTRDLHMEDVKTSCKCTLVTDVRKTISPGESSRICVRYRFGENRGRFSQAVAVRSDDPYFPLTKLVLVGNGIQKVKIAPSALTFGRLAAGMSATARCFVSYTGDSHFEVKSAISNSKHLQVRAASVTPALLKHLKPLATGVTMDECRNLYVVESVIDTTGMDLGKQKFVVEIVTNLRECPTVTLPAKLTVVSRVETLPNRVFLGEVSESDLVHETVIIKSRLGSEITIESVDSGATGLNCAHSPHPCNGILLTLTGRITDQSQIGHGVITVRLRESESDDAIVVELPVVGLLRRAGGVSS